MKRCLLLVLAIPLFAASPALAQPARDQYIAQADPICTASKEAQAAVTVDALVALDRGKLERAARKIRLIGAIFGASVEQIAALTPPVADSQLIASWIESLRAQVPLFDRYANSIAHQRVKRVARLGRKLVASSQKSRAMVGDYGFFACDEL